MSCENLGQILSTTGNVLNTLNITEGEAAGGLKQALEMGVLSGVSSLGKTDGFMKNAAYQILMPKEIRDIESKIMNNPLAKSLAGPYLDKVKTSMNRGAEQAMQAAKPIFVSAIRNMTVPDAIKIVTGRNGGATDYLRRATSAELLKQFRPIISKSLANTNIETPWNKVSSAYNMIAGKKITTDLNTYVAQNAMDAMFGQIKKEESRIRTNPVARSTDLMKKVFAYADKNKTTR